MSTEYSVFSLHRHPTYLKLLLLHNRISSPSDFDSTDILIHCHSSQLQLGISCYRLTSGLRALFDGRQY